MRVYIILLFMCLLQFNGFSQTTEPDSTNALLFSHDFPNGNSISLNMPWDQNNPSGVAMCDIIFEFTSKQSGCPGIKIILKSKDGWVYKDDKITIEIQLRNVETFFGQQLEKIVLKNKGIPCLVKNFVKNL